MTRLSPQQEQLLSQAQDPANYPNILTTAFSNLERDIQKVWDATYGIRFEYNNRTYSFNGWETAPDGMVVRLLVLAVQGALIKTESGLIIRNEDPLARNEIVLLNKTWVPDEPTKESSSGANTVEMVLNTTNNSNKKVTINLATGIRASGIFVVQEDLVQDIKDIFSGTSYPFFKDKPVLTYVYRKKP
jgi:hypothetical protein